MRKKLHPPFAIKFSFHLRKNNQSKPEKLFMFNFSHKPFTTVPDSRRPFCLASRPAFEPVAALEIKRIVENESCHLRQQSG